MGFGEKLSAMKAKQEAADQKKKEEEKKAQAEAAKEIKKNELQTERESVSAEIDQAEQEAKEADAAIKEAEAFAAEQGENLDPEAKAEIDAIKIEAGEVIEKFTSLKAEMARIDEEIAALSEGETIADEIPVETTIEQSAVTEEEKTMPETAPESKTEPEAEKKQNVELSEEEKRAENKKIMTEIRRKHNAFEELSIDELKCLYAVKRTFPSEYDPSYILEKRNPKEDYAKIFNCQPEQVVAKKEELNDNTVVVYGDLNLTRDSQIEELPASLIHIAGNVLLDGSQIKELSDGLTSIGGNLRTGPLEELPNGLTSVGGTLIGLRKLKKLPTGLTSIGKSLHIEQCMQIEEVELPDGLTSIGGDLYINQYQSNKLPKNYITDKVNDGILKGGCIVVTVQ